jgi:Ca-activated chloride channel family protein
MTFAHPALLYFLLALPLLAGLRSWAAFRSGKVVGVLTSPRLRSDLVVGASTWRAGLIFSLQLIALACFILAMAQPRWGEDKIIQIESGRNVIIAIDTSRSMLADDVSPDRITRARLAAQDVLGSLKTDRVGLIAFAGNAYLQAPLTTDHEAVIEAIQSLDFTSVPRGGSDIGKALKLAMETFEKNPCLVMAVSLKARSKNMPSRPPKKTSWSSRSALAPNLVHSSLIRIQTVPGIMSGTARAMS